MIRCLAFTACLMSLVFATVGVAAQDTVCETFSTSPAECGYPYGCKSNNLNTIVGDEGPGMYHIEYETFTCSGTNKQCNSSSQVPVSVPNPYCSDGGGGGGGCGGNCPCGFWPDCSCMDCSDGTRRNPSSAAARRLLYDGLDWRLRGECHRGNSLFLAGYGPEGLTFIPYFSEDKLYVVRAKLP
jgi:hypothetical protein